VTNNTQTAGGTTTRPQTSHIIPTTRITATTTELTIPPQQIGTTIPEEVIVAEEAAEVADAIVKQIEQRVGIYCHI